MSSKQQQQTASEGDTLRRRRRKPEANEGDPATSRRAATSDEGNNEGGAFPSPPAVSSLPIGKTPDGTLFPIPQTHDMLSSLFDPRLPKSHIDLLTLSLLALQLALFLALSRTAARTFFLPYFALWRLAYDAGLGYVLRKQSETRWIVRTVVRQGWMDPIRRPKVYRWVRSELQAKMGKDYDFNTVPIEFNVWIMFRHFVDVILLNDFLSYVLMAFSFLQFPGPPNHSNGLHALRWLGGTTLILFNLWVKVDAHKIVKDFAWYWGDAFFLSLQNLVFDGVFELAPHPMYSVGYAGYYGLSLIAASETVLFVSLAAHACQFGFLVYFENPHIERTYGERKPLAARTPLRTRAASSAMATANGPRAPTPDLPASHHTEDDGISTSTPSLTDTADSDHEDDTPDEALEFASQRNVFADRGAATPASSHSPESDQSEKGAITRHDLDNKYFSKDLLVLKNFDFFRSADLAFALVILYSLTAVLLPAMSRTSQTALAFTHALLWRAFHTVGLGLALKAQSEKKWLVRHFLKHYHYEREGQAGEQALGEWKRIYNLSLCMTYVSFTALAWKCYSIPVDWTVGTQLVRHTLGILLIALHVWTAHSTFEVLGPFGWFYGDFFIEDYPSELYYTGIFRFLNNPERSMGGAAFFGLVLICGSKLLLVQAVIAVLAHWWFLSTVENPHMRKLYGDALRKDAGVTKTLRNVAARNARVFGGVTRGVKEVHGTFEKVLEETAEAFEEFLSRSGPRIQHYVEDTKVLLKQSGERFVISRVASDLQAFDQTQYSMSIRPPLVLSGWPRPSTSAGPPRFHLGEPIVVDWRAPLNHSAKDWVGVYRLGANASQLVTTVSSQGKWISIHDEEQTTLPSEGTVVFEGKRLPWTVGLYELRYHHDGKHNVMTSGGPIEIFVQKSRNIDDPVAIYETLSVIIAQTLAFERNSIPAATLHLVPAALQAGSALTLPTNFPPSPAPCDEGGISTPALSDPDDFVIYSTSEADHIAYAVKEAFDVEIANEVVLAAANTSKLARRIAEARRLLRHRPTEDFSVGQGSPEAS